MYSVGVALAVASGVAHNIGALLQKKVVNQISAGRQRFFAELLRQPLWLAGFIIHMGLGTALFSVVIASLILVLEILAKRMTRYRGSVLAISSGLFYVSLGLFGDFPPLSTTRRSGVDVLPRHRSDYRKHFCVGPPSGDDGGD